MADPKRTPEDDLFDQGDDVDALFEQGDEVASAPPAPDETSISSAPYGPQPNPLRTPGVGESFVQGAANTFGTGDIIGAGLQSGLQAAVDLPDLFLGDMTLEEANRRKWKTFSDARKENLRLTQEGMREHPIPSIAGRLLPGAMLAPGIGVANSLAASGVTGAITGGIEGAAQSDKDSVAGVLSDSSKAAGFGGAGGMLGYGAGRYVLAPVGAWVGQKVGNALATGASDIEDAFRRFAQERALKASGYIQKDLPKDKVAYERLLRSGQVLLDEPGLIRPLASAANIGERLDPLVEREGRLIGQYLDEADAASALAADTPLGGGFNPYAFAEGAQETVATPFTRNPSLTQEGRGVSRWLRRLTDTADEQLSEGQPFSFRQANEYKGDLQNAVFNKAGSPKANKAAQNELQRALTGAIDEQAEPFIGDGGVEGFRRARRMYGAFQDAREQTQEQVNREVGNNFFGLKDMQSGQMAQQTRGLEDLPYIGPAAALGSKLLRGRMDSTAARAADAVAGSGTLAQLRGMSPEVVGGYGAAFGGAAGAAAGDWLTTLAQTNPEALGKWGKYLGAAASQSPEALGAAHRELSETDPEYQDAMRRNGGQSP